MARSRTVEMTSGLGGPGAVVTLVSAPIASYGPCVRHVQTGCTSAWSASVSSLAMNTASPPSPLPSSLYYTLQPQHGDLRQRSDGDTQQQMHVSAEPRDVAAVQYHLHPPRRIAPAIHHTHHSPDTTEHVR